MVYSGGISGSGSQHNRHYGQPSTVRITLALMLALGGGIGNGGLGLTSEGFGGLGPQFATGLVLGPGRLSGNSQDTWTDLKNVGVPERRDVDALGDVAGDKDGMLVSLRIAEFRKDSIQIYNFGVGWY